MTTGNNTPWIRKGWDPLQVTSGRPDDANVITQNRVIDTE